MMVDDHDPQMDLFLNSTLFSDSKDLLLPQPTDDDLFADAMDFSAYGSCDDMMNSFLPQLDDDFVPQAPSVNKQEEEIQVDVLADHNYLSPALPHACEQQQTVPASPSSSDSGLSSCADFLPSPTLRNSPNDSPVRPIVDCAPAPTIPAGQESHSAEPENLDVLSMLNFDKDELEKALEGISAEGLLVTPEMLSPTDQLESADSPSTDIDSLLSSFLESCQEGESTGQSASAAELAASSDEQRYSPAPSESHSSVLGCGELQLSPEEKLLLDKEGISLPSNMPLTRNEEKVLRAVRRRIRNKESARNSRRKKQVYVDQLEERVKMCAQEKKALTQRVKQLEDFNNSLLGQLKKLQNLVTTSSQKPVKRSTCAMILALSFAFFLMPSYQSYMAGEDGIDIVKSNPITGKTRSLLLNDQRVQRHTPFYRKSLKSLLADSAVDPVDLAVQSYVDREMKNETTSGSGGASGGEYVSVRLTKDKTPIISLHNHSKELPAMGGTASKFKDREHMTL